MRITITDQGFHFDIELPRVATEYRLVSTDQKLHCIRLVRQHLGISVQQAKAHVEDPQSTYSDVLAREMAAIGGTELEAVRFNGFDPNRVALLERTLRDLGVMS